MAMELATLEAYSGTTAVLSKGFELYVEDPDTPDSWIRVGLVTAMPSLSDGTQENVEVTNLSSLFKEFINGLADPTSVESTVEADFDLSDAGQVIVEQAYMDDRANSTETELNFAARLPVNDAPAGSRAEANFSAIVIDHDVVPGINEQMKMTATLRKTTATTRTWRTAV